VSVLVVGRGRTAASGIEQHERSNFATTGAPALPSKFIDADEPARQTPQIVLDEAKGALAGVRSSVTYTTLHGQPQDALIQWLVEEHPTVILIGSRGRGRGHRWLLGSVSTAVAFRAPCSVLVMRQRSSIGASVLMGFDDSDDVEAVFPLLGRMLSPSSLVKLMAAVPRRALFPSSLRPRAIDTFVRASSDRFIARQARLQLGAAVRELCSYGLVNVETKVVFGEPADELLHEVRISSPDLLVLGAAGRRGVRMFPGNVTERLLHDTRCSVLIGRS